MKKIVLLAFVLVFSSVAMFVRFTRPVEASGTIYIRADGSIEGTTFIQTADNITYIFVANINDSIVVERNNIVVDGNGYTLQGNGSGTGIDLSERENVTVRNTQIKKFSYGIWLRYSNNNSISGNNITENNWYGIYLYPSSNYNSIVGNNITENNNDGINLWGSSGNNIVGNNIKNSYYGIDLRYSSDNIISGNNITNNNYNGISLSYSSGNMISGNNVTANNQGIDLFSSSGNIISGNNITNNDDGIGIWYSSNNSIAGNTITANSGVGISLSESSNNNSISENNLRNNYGGILLYSSSNNTLTRNNITNNNHDGISLSYSSGNIISGNNITNNNYNDIYLSGGIDLFSSSGNIISGNKITNNKRYGIQLLYSSNNNSIYHNNFINNLEQVYSSELTNTWDDGTGKGNYWSDYKERYPNATEIDESGIWGTPYVINENNQDNYPLMSPWGDIEPPVADAGPDLTVYVGTTVTFDGSKSSDDVAIKSYVWAFTDITPQTLIGMHPNYPFNNVGDFKVTLNVSDYAGYWDTDTMWVHVLSDTTKPSICTVSQEPQVPDEGEKVIVTVNVTDGESGVHNVTISYRTNSGAWTNVSMSKLTGDTWEGEILGLPVETNVQYKIIAYDKAGNFEVDDQLGQYYVYTVIPEFPTWTPMLIILILLTVAITIYKRRLLKTQIH